MDALDIRILRELEWKPVDADHVARGVQRPWDIARRLGVHGNTVKARLDALRESGVFRGIICAPADAALGIRTVMYGFRWETTREKREGLRDLAESGSIAYHYDFMGPEAWAAVQTAEHESPDARARLLARASGAATHEHLWSRPAVPKLELTALDYRIMLAFHADALRAHADVAAEVGVTPKTVRARFNRLVENRMIAIAPMLNLGAARGDCTYAMAVRFEPGTDDATRARFILSFDNVITRRPPAKEAAFISLAAPTIEAAEDDLVRAEGHDAVASARVLFHMAMESDLDRLRVFLESRLRALAGLPEA